MTTKRNPFEFSNKEFQLIRSKLLAVKKKENFRSGSVDKFIASIESLIRSQQTQQDGLLGIRTYSNKDKKNKLNTIIDATEKLVDLLKPLDRTGVLPPQESSNKEDDIIILLHNAYLNVNPGESENSLLFIRNTINQLERLESTTQIALSLVGDGEPKSQRLKLANFGLNVFICFYAEFKEYPALSDDNDFVQAMEVTFHYAGFPRARSTLRKILEKSIKDHQQHMNS